MKKILIIAGEASSDMHAANLVQNIKALDEEASFFGLGGDKMQEAGVDLLENILHLAFIGPGGLFRNYVKLRKIYNSLCSYIKDNVPDCAILIDYAEFNLKVAQELKKLGVPVVYYISPQVWAWGLWRIKTIKRLVDRMLVLFKFEETLYKSRGVNTTFVGHPLLDIVKPAKDREEVIKNLNLSSGSLIVGILPGSRKSEIKNILPIMLNSCKLIVEKSQGERIEFLLPVAPTIDESYIRDFLKEDGLLNIRVTKNYTYDALSICDAAIVASGTATLETALLNVPMAIIYKANILTYIVTRSVIKLPFIGLVNVVAGERIVPEFLQYEARPERISDYIVRLLKDKGLTRSMKEKFARIKDMLGSPGGSRRAADEVVNFLRGQVP